MMAQAVAVLPQNNFQLADALKLTSEIQQYERLLKLRDDVVAGTHPRIKLNSNAPTNGNLKVVVGDASNQTNTAVPSAFATPTSLPGLSTISSNLVDADSSARSRTRLERQRIERDILESFKKDKDVVGQRGYEQDILPDFDVSEVFFQVQDNTRNLTQPSNRNANSLSGDEGTFYSSGAGTEGSEEHNGRRPTTKPCKFFFEDGSCKKGDRCNFSHDLAFKQQLQKTASTPHKFPGQSGYTAKGGRIRDSPTYENAEEGELADETPYSPSMNIAVEELPQPEANGQVIPAQAGPIYAPPNGPHIDNRQQGKYPQKGKDTQIVRNHITSPVAPQPSRVSPLAVAKVSRIDKARSDNSRTGHQRHDTGSQQSSKSRKRRRDVDANDQIRNVAPRTTMASPEPYIKPEPLSPPPLSAIPQQTQFQSGYANDAPRYGERIIRETVLDYDARAPTRSVQTPTGHRRVISGPGPASDPRRQQDLRRIVSTRNFERPVSPGFESGPRPSTSSHYVLPREEPLPLSYTASVQPPRQTYLVEDRPLSPALQYSRRGEEPQLISMPAPSGRVVVDEYGNKYLETTVPDKRATAMPEIRYVEDSRRRQDYIEAIPDSIRAESRYFEQRTLQPEYLHPARASVRPEPRYQEQRYISSEGLSRASVRPEPRYYEQDASQGAPPIFSRASVRPETRVGARGEGIFINPTFEQINPSDRSGERVDSGRSYDESAHSQKGSLKGQSRPVGYRASEQPNVRQAFRPEISYTLSPGQIRRINIQSSAQEAEEYGRMAGSIGRMSVKPREDSGRASIRPVDYVDRGYRQSVVPDRLHYQEVRREPASYVTASQDDHRRVEYIDPSPGLKTYRYIPAGKDLPSSGRAYDRPVYLD